MQKLPRKEQGRVLGEAGKHVYVTSLVVEYVQSKLTCRIGFVVCRSSEAGKRKTNTASPSEALEPRLPAHLSAAFYPSDVHDPLEELLGQTIRYRQSKDSILKECRVIDYGTSRLKGEWYCIEHGDDDEYEITANEMKAILASRV